MAKKRNLMEEELKKVFSDRSEGDNRDVLVARRKDPKFASLVVAKR